MENILITLQSTCTENSRKIGFWFKTLTTVFNQHTIMYGSFIPPYKNLGLILFEKNTSKLLQVFIYSRKEYERNQS